MGKRKKMNNKVFYEKLLRHPRWFEKRNSILKRDLNQCKVCGSSLQLNVHHKQYHYSARANGMVAPWQYQDKYLITLCANCHKKGHSLFNPIPVFKIS